MIAPKGGSRNIPATIPMTEPQIPTLPAPHLRAVRSGRTGMTQHMKPAKSNTKPRITKAITVPMVAVAQAGNLCPAPDAAACARLRPFLPPAVFYRIEVTTHCPAACVYCPRMVYRRLWQRRHMSFDTFQLMLGMLAKCGMVYLQGWGEPLTHPGLFDMVRTAKAAGCRVGLTTSGMHLDEETCTRLVREGVDLVAFSLAGTDEQNDAVRRGTRFGQVTEAVRTLQRTKSLLGSDRPALHLAYLLLQSRWQEVQALPTVMQRLNVQQAVISTLDFVAAPDLASETVLPASQEAYEVTRTKLDEVAQAGSRAGLSIHYWLASPPETETEARARSSGEGIGLLWLAAKRPTCTENIHRSAFVSADGAVSPCVYMAVPAPGAMYVADGTERSYTSMSFGNIHDTPLETIWCSRPYAAFRAAHRRGYLPERCLDCPRSRMLQVG